MQHSPVVDEEDGSGSELDPVLVVWILDVFAQQTQRFVEVSDLRLRNGRDRRPINISASHNCAAILSKGPSLSAPVVLVISQTSQFSASWIDVDDRVETFDEHTGFAIFVFDARLA